LQYVVDAAKLQLLNCKYVLNMTEQENGPIDGVQQLMCPLLDSDQANIAQYFQEAFEFIQRAIADRSTVLVHCERGVSRSATIVIAWLMHSERLGYREAVDKVQEYVV
jgi:dual specificity phosphatase 10